MLLTKDAESGIVSTAIFNRPKFFRITLALLLAAIVIYMFLTAACTRKNEEENIQLPAQVLPSESDELHRIMSSCNISGSNLVVSDGRSIFYNDRNDNFVRTDLQGSYSEILFQGKAVSPFISDENVFFADGADFGSLTKIKSDGTNKVRIGSNDVSNIIFFNNYIYAIEFPKGTPVRVKPDGTGRVVISEGAFSSMILHQGRFYLAGMSSDQGIVLYDPESEKSNTIASITAACIQAENNHLYFTDMQKQYQLFALDISAENYDPQPSLIFSQAVEKPFIISNGWLFYIDSSKKQQIFMHKIEVDEKISSDAAVVVDDAADRFVVLYPFIFYQRPDQNRIYRTVIGNNRPEPVS